MFLLKILVTVFISITIPISLKNSEQYLIQFIRVGSWGWSSQALILVFDATSHYSAKMDFFHILIHCVVSLINLLFSNMPIKFINFTYEFRCLG